MAASSYTKLIALILLILVYHIAWIVYNLYFHALKRFPGPKFAAATYWYEFFRDFVTGHGGQYINEVERMHDEYGANLFIQQRSEKTSTLTILGSIIRVTPNEIHIRDPEWAHVLYESAGTVSLYIGSRHQDPASFAINLG